MFSILNNTYKVKKNGAGESYLYYINRLAIELSLQGFF